MSDYSGRVDEDGYDESMDEDEYDESMDEDDENPWLKDVEVVVKNSDGEQAGYCKGSIIDRDSIRNDFYGQMEEVSQDLKEFCLRLFDRWGDLKSEYLKHPIKKGTGVWGKEFNKGSILLVTEVYVYQDFRHQGYGKQLVQDIWTKARASSNGCELAAAWTTYLTRDLPSEMQNPFFADPPSAAAIAMCEEMQRSSENFWRAVGFRAIGNSEYVGFSAGNLHPSKAVSALDDYRRPSALRRDQQRENQVFPYDDALARASDPKILATVRKRLQNLPTDDSRWHAVDAHGNSIMHFLAALQQSSSLGLLLEQPFANQLLSSRNLEGETPLEHLQAHLEKARVASEYMDMLTPESDNFTGFKPTTLDCLLILLKAKTSSPSLVERVKFGCTCEGCLSGFLSPRMAFALTHECDTIVDALKSTNGHCAEFPKFLWVRIRWPLTRILPVEVLAALAESSTLRQGFKDLYQQISIALRSKCLPLSSYIQEQVSFAAMSSVKVFLDTGSTVADLVVVLFDLAMGKDEYLGDGTDLQTSSDENEKLKHCRNDREFIFARRQYCRMDGLPVDYEYLKAES